MVECIPFGSIGVGGGGGEGGSCAAAAVGGEGKAKDFL